MPESQQSTSLEKRNQQSNVLLVTKFAIPQIRPGLLPRAHLTSHLEAATTRELILISTPPGFGKTTLLASWARSTERPVAWLSLDNSDNDPTHFWRCIVAAVERVHQGIRAQALSLLRSSPQPNIEAAVTTFLNELAAQPGELVLVLDDYHLLGSTAVHNSLAFLLEHLLPGMHIVIASRSDPPIPLARFRARGQMVELKTADLRFTFDEVATLLRDVWELNLSEASMKCFMNATSLSRPCVTSRKASPWPDNSFLPRPWRSGWQH